MADMDTALAALRAVTGGTAYEGRLYLVGGALRDRELGLPTGDEVDLVLEGDAVALARWLAARGISEHQPVTYPRFGTAMLTVQGTIVELVSARAESYEPTSRKPHVRRATLRDDVLRRDFTINTLLENLHTGERLDLTGRACSDLHAGVIRTPLEPIVTFHDDPLRMLRAIRFAVRLGFTIDPGTWEAIRADAFRLSLMGPGPPVVSAERIRDEFMKTVLSPDPAHGIELLHEAGLLRHILPELEEMIGVRQNDWHAYDVWQHTLHALRALPADAALDVRLGLLLHDVGKPRTRTEDERGIHFYEHQFVGAEMARTMLHRLKLPNDDIHRVVDLVSLHMRLGEARPEWSEPAIKRLIRDTELLREPLFTIARCDIAAMSPDAPVTDLDALRERIEDVDRRTHAARLVSPLDGRQIMDALGIPGGPLIGRAKDYLLNEVIEGRLPTDDTEAALSALHAWARSQPNDECYARR
jgi:poly(A) polymerase